MSRGALGTIASFGLLLVVFLVWKVPNWQTAHLENISPAERAQIENENRRTLIQFLAGGAILIGLLLTWKRIKAIEEGQITERFTRAIDQLGRDKREIRLGGIYALERIAKDSKKDHWPIMEILSAYIREGVGIYESKGDIRKLRRSEKRPPTTDIQAILTVLGRRRREHDEKGERLNLEETDLREADLSKGHFERASFRNAWLGWSNLYSASLSEVDFSGADLNRANLTNADLTNTQLSQANLEEANLEGADLSGANLRGPDIHIELHPNPAESVIEIRQVRVSPESKAAMKLDEAFDAQGLTWDQLNRAKSYHDARVPSYLLPEEEDKARFKVR